MNAAAYGSAHDAIVKTLQLYIEGCRRGDSAVMRRAFHEEASFFGYAGADLATGLPFLFAWVDRNGPSPGIRPRFASVDIVGSIAAVRLEVDGWSGSLAGPDVCMSDIFTLLHTSDGWKIIQKAFHWHAWTAA